MYNLQLDITTVIFEEGAWLTMAHYQVVLPSAKMLVDIATDVPPLGQLQKEECATLQEELEDERREHSDLIQRRRLSN